MAAIGLIGGTKGDHYFYFLFFDTPGIAREEWPMKRWVGDQISRYRGSVMKINLPFRTTPLKHTLVNVQMRNPIGLKKNNTAIGQIIGRI